MVTADRPWSDPSVCLSLSLLIRVLELNHQLFHTLIRFPFCWARKRADDGQPAPALTGLDMADHKTKLPNHYPFLEIFYDAEEALLSRRKRFDGFVLPTSAVERAYRRLQRSQTAA